MADKKPKEKNVMKIGWELQFLAENIFVECMGHFIAGTCNVPTDEEVLKLVEASIRAAIIFDTNRRRFGLKDRVTDSVNEEEE